MTLFLRIKIQLLLYGLLVGITPASSLFAQHKIGYVDLEYVLRQMPEMEEAQKQVREYGQQLQMKLSLGSSCIYSPRTFTFTHLDSIFLPELKRLIEETNANIEEAEERLRLKHMELLGPLEKRAHEAIRSVAFRRSFDYVLNQSTGILMNGLLDLSPAVPENDLTRAVMKELGIDRD